MVRSVELFAGAGGLAMGATLAGFEHSAVIEWDRWACDTIRENAKRDFPLVRDWRLYEEDVRQFNFTALNEDIDLLTGGPPCQPFSLGGKHKAFSDKRDMFPAMIEAVHKLRPRSFLIENVKGLTRASFTTYLQYILLHLTFPDLSRKKNETWSEHLARLEREKTSGAMKGLTYDVVCRVLNSADYGIPQRRERVFIVGFRHDQGVSWSFPEATHSIDALLADQWVTKEYWERHEVPKKSRPVLPKQYVTKIEKIRRESSAEKLKPWRTVRDALRDLPDPAKTRRSPYTNHVYQAGARVYTGHTGSVLDLPAKTLKAGDHGVPGGENMMVKPSGDVRYFTVRESARLQTFPDGYLFHGSWTETMRQLGNAVPVALARIFAASIAEKLIEVDLTNLEKRQ